MTEARRAREPGVDAPPKVSARRALQPKRTHVKIVFMGLTDANQLLLEWRPPGAGLGGSLHPGLRRTPCSSPGVILVWLFEPGRSPQKVSVMLEVIASKVKQSQRNFREILFSQITSYCSRTCFGKRSSHHYTTCSGVYQLVPLTLYPNLFLYKGLGER